MKLILVIEDNLDLRENTVELLELAGYKVITANDGKAGYQRVLGDSPDVVLCDMVMPHAGGTEFLKMLKDNKATREIPLIFFSAGSAPVSVRKGLIEGADAYLKKPFTNDELVEAVKQCLLIGKRRKSEAD